jgi:hypothetical protein
MTGIEDLDSRGIRPLGLHRVTRPGQGQAQDVETRSNIPHPSRREGRNAVTGPHAPASLRMSLSTPAAVTSAPAPGPVMTSGFDLYRAVVKTS